MVNILKYKNSLSGGGIFVFATVISNFLNFFFNAYLGRTLNVVDFGLVTFINTLVLLLGILVNAFGSSVTHRVAFLSTNSSKNAAYTFINRLGKKAFTLSVVAMILWVILIPVSSDFFKVGDLSIMLLFTPVFSLFLTGIVLKGYLTGGLFFWKVSLAMIMEALSKILFAIVIQYLGYPHYSYLAIPLSLSVALLMFYIFSKQETTRLTDNNKNYAFPRRFFVAAVITGLSTSSFLTLDLILVKHYFLPAAAGEYSLLSLGGKMIFFAGSLFNALILIFTSRDLGHGVNTNKSFSKLILGTVSLTSLAYLGVGILGFIFMPIAFGAKVAPIIQYLPIYGFAIGLFTISSAFVTYHLAKHHYSFSLISLISSVFLIIGIYFNHQSIGEIVKVILSISIINIFLVFGLHYLQRNGRFLLSNIIDLFDILSPLPKSSGIKGKKILIFNWRDTKHALAGGAEEYIHELAKRWVKDGHIVNVFCGNDGNSERNEIVDGVRIIRRGGFYFVYVWAFLYYVLRFRGKYDVIIDCQNGVPFFTPLYVKEKTFCLMFHVHQEVFKKSLSGPMALIASVLENRMMPWAYRRTKFITISESSKKDMVDLGFDEKKISIVYPGVDLSKLKPGIKSKKPTILYLGRLKEYKSVDIFVKAAAKIKKEFPNVKFLIAGDGDHKIHLENLSEKMGLKNQIKFLGKVSEAEKIKLYQEAWIFVNPSFMEGWGITSIEANACGTPVIASDVPGLRDSVNNPHSGFLFKYGNTKELVEKINLILKDRKLRNKMYKESVIWANNFNWDKSSNKGLQLIK